MTLFAINEDRLTTHKVISEDLVMTDLVVSEDLVMTHLVVSEDVVKTHLIFSNSLVNILTEDSDVKTLTIFPVGLTDKSKNFLFILCKKITKQGHGDF